jgi:hypothetical protein
MIQPQEHHRETQYRPQAGKTLRHALITFITQEFPRLGGPWIIELFVDKLLELINTFHISRNQLKPGQTIWPAVAIDERPSYGKSMTRTRQVPVLITLVNQHDIADLRNNVGRIELLKRSLVRAAHDAYEQGGVLTVTDLSLLFQRSHSSVATLIRQHEEETSTIVPRRGNLHDMGPTISHKTIICRKAFLEGKMTHVIARETYHSPEAVDRYILDFARVHFAVFQRSMTPEETAFSIQRPLSLVEEYIALIEQFDLAPQQVYDRAGLQLTVDQAGSGLTFGTDGNRGDEVDQRPLQQKSTLSQGGAKPAAELADGAGSNGVK